MILQPGMSIMESEEPWIPDLELASLRVGFPKATVRGRPTINKARAAVLSRSIVLEVYAYCLSLSNLPYNNLSQKGADELKIL